jgi:hypothetical protein
MEGQVDPTGNSWLHRLGTFSAGSFRWTTCQVTSGKLTKTRVMRNSMNWNAASIWRPGKQSTNSCILRRGMSMSVVASAGIMNRPRKSASISRCRCYHQDLAFGAGKSVELDALAKMSPERQATVVAMVESGMERTFGLQQLTSSSLMKRRRLYRKGRSPIHPRPSHYPARRQPSSGLGISPTKCRSLCFARFATRSIKFLPPRITRLSCSPLKLSTCKTGANPSGQALFFH